MAHAAIVILTAIADQSASRVSEYARRVQVLPHPGHLDYRQAALLVSKEPKPVQCQAKHDGDVLQISCRPLAPDDMWLYDGLRRVREAVPVVRQASDHALREKEILIVGAGEYVSLKASNFQRLQSEYLFGGKYIVLSGPPVDYGITENGAALARWYSASESETRQLQED